eukprot:scaffold27131_cov15-Tisochrysis_lutea.AAC.1
MPAEKGRMCPLEVLCKGPTALFPTHKPQDTRARGQVHSTDTEEMHRARAVQESLHPRNLSTDNKHAQ